jgi:hypothetical protein
MKWFKHDSNAHRDVKLRKLMMRFGLEGYGLYFYCLERITDKLSTTNLTFRLEDDAEILAHDTGLHVDDVNGMMRFMVELELFEDSQGVITCLKLAKRLDQSQAGNKTMRNMIAKVRENHDGIMTTSGQSHDSVMLEEKRKEQKRSIKRFTPPTVEEVDDYCKERNNGINGEKFVDYYAAQGWVLKNGNKMKDWKATVRNWEKNDKQPKQADPTEWAI